MHKEIQAVCRIISCISGLLMAKEHKDRHCQATRLAGARYAWVFNIICIRRHKVNTLMFTSWKCGTADERIGTYAALVTCKETAMNLERFSAFEL